MADGAHQLGGSRSCPSQIGHGEVKNPSIEVVYRIFEALDEDIVLDIRRKKGTRPPSLAYRSPFTLEELAAMDEEYSGQDVVQLVRDVLKGPTISLRHRQLLARQIEGLVRVTREELSQQKST